MAFVPQPQRYKRSVGGADKSADVRQVSSPSQVGAFCCSRRATSSGANLRSSGDRSPFSRGERAVVKPNVSPNDSTKWRIAGSSSLFQFIALVLKVNGRPLTLSRAIPFMKARNDPGVWVKRSKACSFTEWQEMSIENGGRRRNRSTVAGVNSVPFV